MTSVVSRIVTVCEAAPVLGRPRYLTRFVEQGLCRARWLASLVAPLWVLTAFLHYRYLSGDLAPAVQSGDTSWLTPALATAVPAAIGVLSALLILLFPRGTSTLAKVRGSLIGFGAGALTCEALHVAFSLGAVEHLPSFAFANLLTLTLLPVALPALLGLLAYGLAVSVIGALALGLSAAGALHLLAVLTLPLAAGAFGIALNLWNYRNFRQHALATLRLRRRTAQLERARRELERQRAEAVRQHGEAERQRRIAENQREEAELQRERAMQLLSGALTGPIAERYERQGFIEPSTRHVVLLFCDAVGFSQACEKMLPERIVAAMREFWLRFDDACLSVGVEPLRAEGDARIAIAGLGMEGGPVHMHRAAIGAILAMLRFRRSLPPLGEAEGVLRKVRDGGYVMWPARMGITIGPVAAGVIDTSHVLPGSPARARGGRLWFDVWGDTLNVAARLAQSARPNQILARERVLWEAGGLFEHGPIHGRRIKKSVLPDCVEIAGIRPEYRDSDGEPNEAFWAVYNSDSYRPARPDPRGTLAASA